MAKTTDYDSLEQKWLTRIKDARRWREDREQAWSFYAQMHRKLQAWTVERSKTGCSTTEDLDEQVRTPHGDLVRVGTIFRNLEQTFALLETPEIGVRATVEAWTEDSGYPDTHREAITEKAVYRSLRHSGLLNGAQVEDAVTLDGVIIGHGISYTWWRLVEEQREIERLVLQPGADGELLPVLDEKTGQLETKTISFPEIVWEGVQDEHIPVLDFLFDTSARSIQTAQWHGAETIMPLAALRDDPRFDIPAELEGSSYRRRNLYGEEDNDFEVVCDAVRVVRVYDKGKRELLHFIDTATGPEHQARVGGTSQPKPERELILIGGERFPVRFAHPDMSPFNCFVPIPAQDDPGGISQIEHIKGLAVEIDYLRSRVANMLPLMKRIFLYRKGDLTQDQIDQALAARDFAFLGIDAPEEAANLSQLFHEFPVPAIRSEFYKLAEVAKDDVRTTSGIAEQPFGGADSATESEHIYSIGSARLQRKKRKKYAWLGEVAKVHLDFLRAFGPEGEHLMVETVTGPELLQFGREALMGDIAIEVQPGAGATAISPIQQKMMIEAAGLIMPQAGPSLKLAFLRQLLTRMDIPDVNGLMAAARQDLAALGQLPGAEAQPPPANIALGDFTNGQALRAAINAPAESVR